MQKKPFVLFFMQKVLNLEDKSKNPCSFSSADKGCKVILLNNGTMPAINRQQEAKTSYAKIISMFK
jgi:hypothetical protein